MTISLKKVILLIILVLMLNFVVYADSGPFVTKKNAVSFNSDSGSVFTYISYERRIVIAHNFDITGQLGLGSIPFVGGINIPHKIIVGVPINKNLFMDLGVGGNYRIGNMEISSYAYYIYPVFGFKYISEYSLLIRLTFCPYFSIYGENFFSGYDFPPPIGVSIGYVF